MDSACGRPTADSSRGGRMDATFPAVPGVLGTCRWENLPSGQRHVDHRGVPVSASRPRTRAPAGEAEIGGWGGAGGNDDGGGAGDWARHGGGSNPWSIKVATMIVAKQTRSIGRGSIPSSPSKERAARPIRLDGL